MRARWLAATPLLLAWAGCIREGSIEPIRGAIALHSVVDVGATTVGVALARVSPDAVFTPITDATVRITRGDATITLNPAGTSSALCFAASPDGSPVDATTQCYGGFVGEPIGPGETLHLDVQLPDGTHIVGATTTPATAVTIETPIPGQAIDVTYVIEPDGNTRVDPVEVRWSGGTGGRAFVELHVIRMYDSGVVVECDLTQADSDRTRSPASLAPMGHCAGTSENPVADSADYRVFVVAHEESADAYFDAIEEGTGGIVLDGASPGLERLAGDAILHGVFGAAVRASVEFRVRMDFVDER